MKTSILAFAVLALMFNSVFGQSKEVFDDIYFKPGDIIKKTERPLVKKPVYKNGAKEIVFIERGQNVEIVTPDTTLLLGEANDSTEQNKEEGYYLNGFNGSESDLEYADRIRKFHNPKYRVYIGDPAYNDIYFLNNFDWNVYVADNYAYVTPTWTNPYWYDYTFNSNSYWGWNSWSYGYPSYGRHYGWGNYPWAMNNYWGYGGYYGNYYGGYYGNYYGGYYGNYYGGYCGYGMGYPYYGYGGHGYYGGYYGGGYGGGGAATVSSRGSGSRQLTNLRTTTIGGSSTYRSSQSVRSNYTTIGESNRTVVNNNGTRSIRSASDYAGRNTAILNNTRTSTSRDISGENNYRPSTYRSSTITTNRTTGSTDAVNRSAYTTGSRETSTRSGYNQGVSTSPRTSYSTQQNQSVRSGYGNTNNTTTRSSYSTGTPTATRQSGSTYSNGSTSTRSSSTSSGSSSYRSSTPSSSYSSPSSSYSSGSSSYSGGSSSGSSSSGSSSSSGGGGRR